MASGKMTPGEWDFACDSYGKVQHSKKACVYTNTKNAKGETTGLISIAARIPNWNDARAIATLPELVGAARNLMAACRAYKVPDTFTQDMTRILARIDGEGACATQ